MKKTRKHSACCVNVRSNDRRMRKKKRKVKSQKRTRESLLH